MLEALAMGAFPIQSNTACADEWLVHGETGMIVPPDDPYEIADALRRALTEDALVDNAAERNAQVAAERLDSEKIKALAVSLYEEALNK
jgi:glycosyltransferase involved in cell wall biosynthesis